VRALRLLAIGALLSAAAYDPTRAPGQQVGARVTIAAIHAYQAAVSPVLSSAGLQCRFTPTCSKYAEAVIARDGLVGGSWLAAKRVVRCGPWTPLGASDPP